jgi:hypothetical protein
MSKSIINTSEMQEIQSRFDKLTADTKPLWGRMNVKQMLRHVHNAANFAFETETPRKKPGLFDRTVMKWMIFHVPAPKNVKTFQPIDMVANKIDPEEFNAELRATKDIFTRVAEFKGEYQPNPFLGVLTKDEWGRLCYVHAHHHLKQFGV